MEIARNMVEAVVRLEKRPAKAETHVETPEHKRVPPLPPLVPSFPNIPTAPHIVGIYYMSAPRMPVGALLPRQFGSEQIETMLPRQFVVVRVHVLRAQIFMLESDGGFNHFLKNGGQLFYGSIAQRWLWSR